MLAAGSSGGSVPPAGPVPPSDPPPHAAELTRTIPRSRRVAIFVVLRIGFSLARRTFRRLGRTGVDEALVLVHLLMRRTRAESGHPRRAIAPGSRDAQVGS